MCVGVGFELLIRLLEDAVGEVEPIWTLEVCDPLQAAVLAPHAYSSLL